MGQVDSGIKINNISKTEVLLKKPQTERSDFVFKAKENTQKETLSNNGRFDLQEAGQNLWKGIKKPFKDVIKYAKDHPLQATLIGSGSIGLTLASGKIPLLSKGLFILGLYFIGAPLVKGIGKLIKAKNGDDLEKAFVHFGESATYTGLSFIPTSIPKPNFDNRAASLLYKINLKNFNLWGNATDIASLAPKVSRNSILSYEKMSASSSNTLKVLSESNE